MRKIHVKGRDYRFRVGKQNVVIRDNEDKARVVRISEITRRTPDVLERGRWKGTSDGMVTPHLIAKWIASH